MSKVDLSQLLGKKSFTILCTLSCNRCKVNTTTLANLRANAFVLLNTKCAKKIFEFLNTLLEILKTLILVKRYNRQLGKSITSTLQTYLQVNKQRLYNILFLVIDLKHYDVILSYK
jgi:hypothetical protein